MESDMSEDRSAKVLKKLTQFEKEKQWEGIEEEKGGAGSKGINPLEKVS